MCCNARCVSSLVHIEQLGPAEPYPNGRLAVPHRSCCHRDIGLGPVEHFMHNLTARRRAAMPLGCLTILVRMHFTGTAGGCRRWPSCRSSLAVGPALQIHVPLCPLSLGMLKPLTASVMPHISKRDAFWALIEGSATGHDRRGVFRRSLPDSRARPRK